MGTTVTDVTANKKAGRSSSHVSPDNSAIVCINCVLVSKMHLKWFSPREYDLREGFPLLLDNILKSVKVIFISF